jgi:hypothetical protein
VDASRLFTRSGAEEKQSLVVHHDDFWASTSNKQLNSLQHVFTILNQHGRAAIVVPDNVLLEGAPVIRSAASVGKARFRSMTNKRISERVLTTQFFCLTALH